MTAHDEILVFETLDQGINRRLPDINQRCAGSLAHDLRRIAEQLDQGRHGFRIADLTEGLGRRTLDRPVTIPARDDQGINRLLVANLAAGLGCMLPDAPPLVLQRRNHRIEYADPHLGRRLDRLVAHFHDRIVEQADERVDRFPAPDLRNRAAGMGAHRPKLIAAGADQRIQGLGFCEIG